MVNCNLFMYPQLLLSTYLLLCTGIGVRSESAYEYDYAEDGKESPGLVKRNVKGVQTAGAGAVPVRIQSSKRLPTTNSSPLWEGRTVPYVLDPNFDDNEVRIILGTLLDITSKTCLRFKPRWSSEAKYVNFVKSQACGPDIIFPGQDELQLNLASPCLKNLGLQSLLLGLVGLPPLEIQEVINYRKGKQMLEARRGSSLARLCAA